MHFTYFFPLKKLTIFSRERERGSSTSGAGDKKHKHETPHTKIVSDLLN